MVPLISGKDTGIAEEHAVVQDSASQLSGEERRKMKFAPEYLLV
jgi:hypothetical protein